MAFAIFIKFSTSTRTAWSPTIMPHADGQPSTFVSALTRPTRLSRHLPTGKPNHHCDPGLCSPQLSGQEHEQRSCESLTPPAVCLYLFR